MNDSIKQLQQKIADFGNARDWEKFHSPKNLAMALSVEASELVEIFQWLTEDESRSLDVEKKQAAAYELADILMYTLLCADRMGIDLMEKTKEKIEINEKRFPLPKMQAERNSKK